MQRCLASTVAVLAFIAGLLLAGPTEAAASGNAGDVLVDDHPPAAADAMAAYNQVDSWVREWKVPDEDPHLPKVSAASVTLRLSGTIIGRGTAVTLRPGGDGDIILDAATQALEEATVRMPVERDALFEESLRQISPMIAVSLELAGPLVPFAPEDHADVAHEVAPGIDGVAVRAGQRIVAFFPGTMLATGTEPAAALSSLVSRIMDDPRMGLKPPGKLAAEHDLVFYRFRAVHIAQPRGQKPPVFLHRGGRVIDRTQLTGAGLREWADGMAGFLMRNMAAAPGGPTIVGELDPITGQARAEVVTGVHIATAALALARYSKTPGIRPEHASEARAAAQALLEHLLDLELSTDLFSAGRPGSIAAAAVTAVVLDHFDRPLPSAGSAADVATGSPEADPMDRLAAAVAAALEEADGDLPPAARQLATWSSALRHRDTPEKAMPALRALFRETPPGHLVSIMPWAGWAELALAPPGEDVPSAIALREMREQVWQHQLTSDVLHFDSSDLAGGIMFTASRQPLPTWHAARPLAFIATMLGDERLTGDDEVAGELSRLLASLRFLRQLSAGEAEGHMYRSPQRAMWGVRASVWDHRMPPEATALALLTVCETLESLNAINTRRRATRSEEQ